MTWEIIFVLVLLGVIFAFMVKETLPVDLTAILGMSILILVGIVSTEDAFTIFSNPAPITVGCMFVLSGALQRTGAITLLGDYLDRWLGQTEHGMLLLVMPIIAVISAFVNNTPVVMVFMPLLISLANKRQIKPSKILIPLSYISICGGCCTLIGTSTNILVSSQAQKYNLAPLNMFELMPIGLVLTAAALFYLVLCGRFVLPNRDSLSSILDSETSTREYLTEVVITVDSPLIQKKLSETALHSLRDSRVLQIIRSGERLPQPLDEVTLAAGDRLRLSTIPASVQEVKNLAGIKLLSDETLGLELMSAEKAFIAEVLVSPSSSLSNKTLRQADFQRNYDVVLLALHREGKNLRRNLDNVRLQYGDSLLVEGTKKAVDRLKQSSDLLLINHFESQPKDKYHKWVATLILFLVVLLGSFKVYPIEFLALVGALTCVLTRCISVEEAYSSVDWRLLFLIFGMLGIGMGLEKSQAIHWIAEEFQIHFGHLSPALTLSLLFALTSLLTTFLSNNAVAVILTPIALELAVSLGVSPRPFLIGVCIGCSACFATPLGYQTNTLVYGPGGYFFKDFLRVGIPLNIIFWALASLIIPWFWPFYP